MIPFFHSPSTSMVAPSRLAQSLLDLGGCRRRFSGAWTDTGKVALLLCYSPTIEKLILILMCKFTCSHLFVPMPNSLRIATCSSLAERILNRCVRKCGHGLEIMHAALFIERRCR